MTIREITPQDAEALRALRLFALQDTPYAFGMDYEAELQTTAEAWQTRCTPTPISTIFVLEMDSRLMGMAGIRTDGRAKTGHVGFIWGVFVHPDARGKGGARRLIRACLDWARASKLARVTLGVAAVNTQAIRVYVGCGFAVYGVEPDVIRIGTDSYDELLMHCWIATAG
jgi:RimJ/RimL family protein N-acetyltransferase